MSAKTVPIIFRLSPERRLALRQACLARAIGMQSLFDAFTYVIVEHLTSSRRSTVLDSLLTRAAELHHGGLDSRLPAKESDNETHN